MRVSIICAILSALICAKAVGAGSSIEVFYVGAKPEPTTINGISVEFFNLEGMGVLDKRLSRNLSSNLDDSTVYLNDFFNTSGGVDWINDAKHAAVGLTKAFAYSLRGVPAIVFDQEKVIYGTLDVERAYEVMHETE
ncbi:DUF1525 domain-containing protein [Vibrio rotiferianus]|uniref:DUF1525 domain-containing protein n=1 Tax=Vibrio rotiferianus TaxID=190895 RepID=UPI0005ED468C|nr:DUF1525 domain-containing protein [Vibrio rotiferianus]